jgi:hypothetical protein
LQDAADTEHHPRRQARWSIAVEGEGSIIHAKGVFGGADLQLLKEASNTLTEMPEIGVIHAKA